MTKIVRVSTCPYIAFIMHLYLNYSTGAAAPAGNFLWNSFIKHLSVPYTRTVVIYETVIYTFA